jgi:short-subunit dehydrogenase
MSRILVTGGSAGIGQAVIEQLCEQGHHIIATSRNERADTATIQWCQLDLSSEQSVRSFCNSDIWGQPIDIVFNNAGYGLIAPIESASTESVREQFEANYFGTMTITQCAMAHFRQQGHGTLLVNTSVGGRMAFPYFGYYNATKHALEASYEALWYECLESAIRIKVIEPGFTQTQFATHGMQMSGEKSPHHEKGLAWLATSMKDGNTATPPKDVARIIVNSMFDGTNQLRYNAGKHSGTLLFLRKILPDSWFHRLIAAAVLRGQKSA